MSRRKIAKRHVSAMSPREVASFLVEHLPELQESMTQAEIELALDDRGWVTNNYKVFGEIDQQTRQITIAKSRMYWLRDPLAKQVVRVWVTYCLGNGLTYKAKDAAVQARLDKFFKDRRNRRMLNAAGQQRSSKKRLIDGEIFFPIFKGEVIRYIDPLQVTDIITDPDDEEHILCYRRETKNQKVLYYADWAVDEAGKALAEQQKDPITKGDIKLEDDVVVYHFPFDALGKRGNGLLSSVVDWSREHRRFMEARVALTQALAKFAWKTSVKGGQAVINDLKTKLQSTLAQTGLAQGVERQPVNAPGGNWIQNQGIDTTPMPRATGAGDAKEDGNSLKLMVCAGSGVMLHYLGDPSTGNLATATAMELPMLKMFSCEQQDWIDAYRDLFAIILQESPDEEPAEIDIDFPPILADDLGQLGTFIAQAAAVFPELKVPEVLQMLLVSLGVNNVAEVMKAAKKQREVIDAEQKANQAAMLSAAGGKPTPGQPALAGKNVQEALERLAAAMEESNKYVPVLAEV